MTSTVNLDFGYSTHVSESQLREAVCAEVAERLKELRVQRGLSMTELAAGAGLSRAMISFVEHKLRNPTLDTLLRIGMVLNIDVGKVISEARVKVLKRKPS